MVTVIRSVEAFRVSKPRGRGRGSVLVRLRDEDGHEGWGEAPHGMRRPNGSGLLGLSFEHPGDVNGAFAGAAVETAAWDLWCRARSMPLAHALGGERTSVVAGARLQPEPMPDALLSRVNRHVGAGYARITLAIAPGWDVEPVRAVRQAFPALALQVEAGGRYSDSPEHEEALRAIDSYGVTVIERPFADLTSCARLQARVTAAVAPPVRDPGEMEKAVRLEAGRAVRLDVNSGLDMARIILRRATEAGWDAWCGDVGGYGVARAASLALGSHTGCTLPSDLTTVPRARQLVTPPIAVHGGVVAVPFGHAGLGHTVDGDSVQALAEETWGVSGLGRAD